MRKIVLTLCLVLAVASANAATDKRVHKSVSLNPTGSLSLDTHNGTITVTTWNQPVVDINARIEPNEFGSAEDVDKTEIKVTGSPDNVRVESDYSQVETHITWFGVSRNVPLVHYTISMPATARLSIDDHNATVRVTGLHNDLRVSSHNGSIDVTDLAGGADIETHNGDVRVAYSRFDRPSTFETHNGGIDIIMPSSSRFHVNASGHHLDLNSEFPAVTRGMSRGRYVGDVNGGGPELRVSTHNGSLRLRRG